MIKLFYLAIIIILVSACTMYSRVAEIIKPINKKHTEWTEIYYIKKLNKNYVPQGIEVYKDYLLLTVHEKDKSSHLIVFKIANKNLNYLFTTNFPNIATHVSDLSMYNNYLYAIDYASNNLYKIDIEETIKNKQLLILETIQTGLSRSGSIIVANYNNNDIIMITQFILSKNIQAYKLNDLENSNKKPIFSISAKYYIQGLYKKDNLLLTTSNKYGIDPIFISDYKKTLQTKKIINNDTLVINGPGRMIEDIALYNNYLVTSDEETYKIYISKNTLNQIIKGK